jgi:hypothetical protein
MQSKKGWSWSRGLGRFDCLGASRAFAVLGCSLGVAFATADAIAAPPSAELFFAVNDGDPKLDVIAGAPSQNGNQVYIASYAALDGSWLITYNVSADYTNNPQTSLTGTVTVENKTQRDTLSFRVGMNVPICPMVERGSFVGGSALLTLTTNGPGTLSCAKDGNPIFRGTTDGHDVGSIFYCPTTLTSTGSSLISYSGTYGLPGVSLAGKPSFETIGMVEEFRLTAKDKLTMQFTLFFKDANGVPPPVSCEMDVDGDGIVGPSDLAEIFANWGVTSFCPSMLPTDFNDDGQVDAADLMILLNAWGDC